MWTRGHRAPWQHSSVCAQRRVGMANVPERSAAESAQAIANAFEAASIPYAIGGALALAVAGVPRGTADVDVNVFVDASRVGEVLDVLLALGIEIDRNVAMARA